jgi:hypothetical protein
MKYLFTLLFILGLTFLYAQEKAPTLKEMETCIPFCALKPEEKKLRQESKFKICGDCTDPCFKDDSCIIELKGDLEYHKKGK